nr:hypothetical protein CFP56_24589 [Quercus suber]
MQIPQSSSSISTLPGNQVPFLPRHGLPVVRSLLRPRSRVDFRSPGRHLAGPASSRSKPGEERISRGYPCRGLLATGDIDQVKVLVIYPLQQRRAAGRPGRGTRAARRLGRRRCAGADRGRGRAAGGARGARPPRAGRGAGAAGCGRARRGALDVLDDGMLWRDQRLGVPEQQRPYGLEQGEVGVPLHAGADEEDMMAMP